MSSWALASCNLVDRTPMRFAADVRTGVGGAMNRRCDVAVLGAGSWGTALAILLARNGHAVGLWGRDEAGLTAIARHRSNEKYLPGQPLPHGLEVEPVLSRLVGAAGARLVAVPSHAFRELVAEIAAMPAGRPGLLWATKGLDPGSGRLLHEVAAELLPCDVPLGVLSGPTFAGEVARRLPTAVTVAATDAAFAREWGGAPCEFPVPHLHERRPPRRADRGRGQERARDRGGRRGRSRLRGEYPGGAHRARPERDGAARRGGGRARRHVHGSRGTGAISC